MTYLRWLVLGCCLCAGHVCVAEGVAMSAPKTQSPLQVTIQPATEAARGQVVEYVVQVWSAIDLSAVQIQIKVPSGASIAQGAVDSQVDLKANQVYLQSVTVRLPDTADAAVQVQVSNSQEQAVRFFAAAQYPLALTPAKSVSVTAGLASGVPRVLPRGAQQVKEYRVR